MSTHRGQGRDRTCPYCEGVFRNLPVHLRACDAIPPTDEVVQR